MFQSRSRVARVFATAAVLTAAACAPERSPTAPVLPEDASLAAGGNGNGAGGARVKVKMLRLASTTLTVDGPSVTATISIGNSGVAYQGGVSLIAEVAQPAALHEAANVETTCVPSQPGSLPNGTCTMTFDVRASSSTSGAGDFTSGPAVLRVRVLHTENGTTTELATKTVDVSLVVASSTPSISSLTLESTTLTIEGPAGSYSATLQNPGAPLQNVLLQGWIVQGSSRYAAGGFTVMCGGLAVLPTGTCEVSSIVVVSNQNSGIGLLGPGPATFELELLQTAGGTVLDTETAAVELVAPSPPAITSITPAFTALMIGGRTESASIAIDNQGPQRSTVQVKGRITQGIASGDAIIAQDVECGGASGVLPSGACTTVASVRLMPASGPFGLVPGSATLEIQLIQTDGTTETTLDTESIPVTLVAATPWIAQSTVQPTIALGTNVQIAVIVTNPTTTTYPNSAVVMNVIQGGVTTQVASAAPGCGVSGVITSGDCLVTFTINLGTSSFSPGGATVELRLTTNSGATLFDVKQYDVTLVQ